jgi:acylphosphatase
MQHIHIIVSGQVQGVGFRWATKREADKLGLTGYVRNQADGKVEIVAAGSAEAVGALLAWAKRGPLFSKVHQVDVTDLPAQADYTAFSIR